MQLRVLPHKVQITPFGVDTKPPAARWVGGLNQLFVYILIVSDDPFTSIINFQKIDTVFWISKKLQ